MKVVRIKALRAGIILAGGLFVSSAALGVVLGDIMLFSALNEPLEATIELDSLEGVDASMITVTVGDQAAYDRVNVEREPFIDNISFDVEVDNADEGRIVLSSTASVNEPYLNLIVSVSEPGGITLREYTLLIELPPDSAVTRVETTPPVAGEAATTAAADPGTYTVAAGDTLYQIALNTRPGANVGVEQMMVAIQRANTDAFIGGNINRLVSGRVLRIPPQQDIDIIDQRSAVAQIAQQNTNLGGQPLASGSNGAGNTAADDRDQLSVLSGDAETTAGGGSSDLAATIAALENELMLSEESLDRARIENLELNNRLSSLQEQIDLLENIIAIEDERIAQMQSELTEQAAATSQALASADTAASAIADINNEPASGLTGLLRNTVFLLVAGLVVVLIALGFLVHRRRQAQLEAEQNSYNPALAAADDLPDADAKPGLLAVLLTRFRRKPEVDDYSEEEADAIIAAQAASLVVVAHPVAAQSKNDSTDHLLDEMGLNSDLLSLDDALDGIDSTPTRTTVEVFTPVEDDVSLNDIEPVDTSEQRHDSDYALTAAAAAFAAIDKDADEAEEVIDFNTSGNAGPVDVPAELEDDDSAETFEFTLKDLPEAEAPAPAAPAEERIETFDFKLSTPAAPQPPVAQSDDAVEVIAFPGSPSGKSASKDNEPALQEEDLSLELGDLSFDDTMLIDDNEEESVYKPRTGNECDTKLDLATAYEAMGDVAEAIEILDEVIADGSPSQVETAQRLKETWQASL